MNKYMNKYMNNYSKLHEISYTTPYKKTRLPQNTSFIMKLIINRNKIKLDRPLKI